MKAYLEKFRFWYEKRKTRERLLVVGLSIACIYAVFFITLYRSTDQKIEQLNTEIRTKKNEVSSWKKQIEALDKIAQTPAYQEWIKQNKSETNVSQEYKAVLKNASAAQWEQVVTTLLKTEPNISLVQVKHQPEVPFSPPSTTSSETIKVYKQQLTLVITSNYFDTIDYISKLEKTLPNIHWDRVNYLVTQYPMAKVEMEFSILYEKKT